MNVNVINESLESVKADITLVFLNILQTSAHQDASLLSQAGFTGKKEQICVLHERRTIFCGIEDLESEGIRNQVASVVKLLKNFTYTTLKLSPLNLEFFPAMIDGIVLGNYQFTSYKSDVPTQSFNEVIFAVSDSEESKKYSALLEESLIVAHATNFVRDLVNQTPYDMTPSEMALTAQLLAQNNELECKVLDENELKNEKMEAMLAVGRASVNSPKLIHLAYKPKNPKKIITLVGKGLTYDSGGLSLKPATSMVTMKMDKAGACAVMGILKAVSELKLDIEVHGFIGAVENMIGGNAYKPDDVLIARSGKSIEVRNTDAEGRLVLADVLNYAQEKVTSDYIFDYATLTGACMVALGPYTTGVMGHNESLKTSFVEAGASSGEYCGTLPFNNQLKKLIKSDIADVCNVSSKPYGGAITAALFLDHFINDSMKNQWVHFDIAGSAYTEGPWDVHSYGGTGAGVRMTINWLKNNI